MHSSDLSTETEIANNRAGRCLVERETGRIVAHDSQVAGWLEVALEGAGENFLIELLPTLSKALLSSPTGCTESEKTLRETSVLCGKHPQFQADVTLTPMFGFAEILLLVTIRPVEKQASEQLHFDALTGLPDRRELSRQRARWTREHPQQAIPHAVLFLDLDGFKKINDCHGHALGDRVLLSLAARWQHCIREHDLLVRYGGDEFVVLLPGIRRHSELQPIVDRLLAATAEPIVFDQMQLQVTSTIGAALAADITVDLDQLVAEADRAMYEGKKKR